MIAFVPIQLYNKLILRFFEIKGPEGFGCGADSLLV